LIEDDGGGFQIKASSRSGNIAKLGFFIRPKSDQTWGFRIAEYGSSEPSLIDVKALTLESIVLPIKF
jgi:hypothetical protein